MLFKDLNQNCVLKRNKNDLTYVNMFFMGGTSDHYFNVILDYFQVIIYWGMWFFTGETV